MKKRMAFILASLLCVTSLAACSKTKENKVVSETEKTVSEAVSNTENEVSKVESKIHEDASIDAEKAE